MPNSRKTELEKKVFYIFKNAGFKVEYKQLFGDPRPEIIAEREGIRIVCSCREENSENVIRNSIGILIHIKNELSVNKLILAVCGIEARGEDKEMASINNILIWEEAMIDELAKLSRRNPQDAKNRLLGILDIKSYWDPNSNSLGQSMNY